MSDQERKLAKVLEVGDVELDVLERNPPILKISANGKVPTGGWGKDGFLIPYMYVQPPPDGIYEYDFVGEPPSGIVAQVISPISASRKEDPMPEVLKGVKVYSSTNSVTEMKP